MKNYSHICKLPRGQETASQPISELQRLYTEELVSLLPSAITVTHADQLSLGAHQNAERARGQAIRMPHMSNSAKLHLQQMLLSAVPFTATPQKPPPGQSAACPLTSPTVAASLGYRKACYVPARLDQEHALLTDVLIQFPCG